MTTKKHKLLLVLQVLRDSYSIDSKSASKGFNEYKLQFPFSWLIREQIERLSSIGDIQEQEGTVG